LFAFADYRCYAAEYALAFEGPVFVVAVEDFGVDGKAVLFCGRMVNKISLEHSQASEEEKGEMMRSFH
jgi:hypothetical protein